MGKIKLKSSYKNANRKQKDETEEVKASSKAAEELVKDEELSDMDDDVAEPKEKGGKSKSGLVKRVRFKAAKRANAIGNEVDGTKKRKSLKVDAQKAKLEEIKKQINSAVVATSASTASESANPLYKLVSQARLTNTLLKTALSKSEPNSNVTKDQLNRILAKSNLTKKDLLGGVKKLDKRSKSKIKKQFWHDSNYPPSSPQPSLFQSNLTLIFFFVKESIPSKPSSKPIRTRRSGRRRSSLVT